MARQYKLIGLADNKVAVEVDRIRTCTFDLKENIQANKVFESFDYHSGDQYELDESEQGNLDKEKYESCKTFLSRS